MDVKCPGQCYVPLSLLTCTHLVVQCVGCFAITTVFSHAQTVVLCGSCATVLCQPTGGKARLTEGAFCYSNTICYPASQRMSSRFFIPSEELSVLSPHPPSMIVHSGIHAFYHATRHTHTRILSLVYHTPSQGVSSFAQFMIPSGGYVLSKISCIAIMYLSLKANNQKYSIAGMPACDHAIHRALLVSLHIDLERVKILEFISSSDARSQLLLRHTSKERQ